MELPRVGHCPATRDGRRCQKSPRKRAFSFFWAANSSCIEQRSDACGCILCAAFGSIDSKRRRWHRAELKRALITQAPVFLEIRQLMQRLPVGVFDAALDDGFRTSQFDEHDVATEAFNDDTRVGNERGANRCLRFEREDQRQIHVHCFAQYFHPRPFANADVRTHTAVENRIDEIHREMIRKQLESGEPRDLPRDGQLTRRSGSEDEDELHAYSPTLNAALSCRSSATKRKRTCDSISITGQLAQALQGCRSRYSASDAAVVPVGHDRPAPPADRRRPVHNLRRRIDTSTACRPAHRSTQTSCCR